MKKIILLTSLIFSSTLIFAQKGFEFGIRVNPQKNALINKSDNDSKELGRKYPIGYSGGVALGYNLTNHVGVELDLLASRQGQTYSGTGTSDPNAYSSLVALQTKFANAPPLTGTYQARAELNVIKIPLMLKVMTDNSKKLFFTAMAGPQLNKIYNVAAEVNMVDQDYAAVGIDPKDLYKKTTVDGVLAFGLGLNVAHFVLTAQARFDYGFSDVENKNMTYTYQGSSGRYFSSGRSGTHNATAALSLGINYRIFQN